MRARPVRATLAPLITAHCGLPAQAPTVPAPPHPRRALPGPAPPLQNGNVWEKAGVAVSVVYGTMPASAYRAAVGNGKVPIEEVREALTLFFVHHELLHICCGVLYNIAAFWRGLQAWLGAGLRWAAAGTCRVAAVQCCWGITLRVLCALCCRATRCPSSPPASPP